jgi:hypothetical protein
MAGMPAWPPPRSESLLNFLSTLFSSGGVTPRGFKHFATSPTHPHAGGSALQAAQNAGRANAPR